MADIEKIIDNLNLPKQILDKSEELLKTLFGPSFQEFGGLIADQVKMRRFTNQIKIFSRAQKILRDNNLDPKKISLKVLAPLIEYSSLEEDENLQEMWAQLTAQTLTDNDDIIFHQNCIFVLQKLSPEGAILLDKIYDILESRRMKRHEDDVTGFEEIQKTHPKSNIRPPKQPHEYPLDYFNFNILELSKKLTVSKIDLQLNISNLVVLGVLKWETDVTVEATKSSEDPEDTDIDVDVSVYGIDDFILTPLGEKFIKMCKSKIIKK